MNSYDEQIEIATAQRDGKRVQELIGSLVWAAWGGSCDFINHHYRVHPDDVNRPPPPSAEWIARNTPKGMVCDGVEWRRVTDGAVAQVACCPPDNPEHSAAFTWDESDIRVMSGDGFRWCLKLRPIAPVTRVRQYTADELHTHCPCGTVLWHKTYPRYRGAGAQASVSAVFDDGVLLPTFDKDIDAKLVFRTVAMLLEDWTRDREGKRPCGVEEVGK